MMLRRMAMIAVAAAGTGGLVSSGAADEAPRTYSWTGLHVGGHFGYLHNTDGVSLAPVNADSQFYFDFNLVPTSPVTSGRTALGGAQIGYDVQAGRLVYGIEADIAATRLRGSGGADTYMLATISTRAERLLDTFATLRARVGVTPFEHSLLYATGGLAIGHAGLSSSVTIYDVNGDPLCGAATGLCAAASTSKWLTGWTIGGGWEQALTRQWSVKLEGLYFDLGTLSHDFDDPTALPGQDPLFHASARFKGSVVRVGVNYKFD